MNARVAFRALRGSPIGTFFGPRHRATVTVHGSHRHMAQLAAALTEEMDDDAWAALSESTRRVINAIAGCDGIDATRYAIDDSRISSCNNDAGALRIVVYVKPGASRRRMLRLAAALAKVARSDFDTHALTKMVS